jgi:hypothetical protein
MPGGKFLVAGPRCRWRRDGPDRNGVLYDADGQVVSDGVLARTMAGRFPHLLKADAAVGAGHQGGAAMLASHIGGSPPGEYDASPIASASPANPGITAPAGPPAPAHLDRACRAAPGSTRA